MNNELDKKNQKFTAKYIVEVNGITTNGFMKKVIERVLYGLIDHINKSYKQTNIKIRETK